MSSEQAIVDGVYLLEKYPGKGGWTYAAIPEVRQDKRNPFGWVKVRGRIDEYELKQYKLLPRVFMRPFVSPINQNENASTVYFAIFL